LKGSIQRDVDRPEEPIAPQVQEVKPDVKPAK